MLTALAATVLFALAGPLFAQAGYPNKPIKIIAPVQPGGGVDLVARTIADRLGRALGQSIVVDNQSGGGGVVGSMATARAAPDGYTLMVGYVGTHGTNPAVRKLPYDAIKDFTPIAMVGGTPNILIVPPTLPVNTLAEFVQYAKKNPGKLSYGSAGPGHAHAPRDGAIEDRRRHRSRACPLSWHRPRLHRHPRRPDPGDVSRPRRRAAAHQGGQGEAVGRHRAEAPSARARRAHVRGTGLPGIHRRAVVRDRRDRPVCRRRS